MMLFTEKVFSRKVNLAYAAVWKVLSEIEALKIDFSTAEEKISGNLKKSFGRI